MDLPPTIPRFEPQLTPFEDPNLPELEQLFDRDWVWSAFRQQLNGAVSGPPQRFRLRQFVHSPGRTAFARFEAHWPPEAFLSPQHFVARLDKDQPTEFFLYPHDARLPGLPDVADPERALDLVNEHVLAAPARRARVQLVTYRPGYRAVLRHRFGRVKLYARVARPHALPRLLDAYDIMTSSGFVLPSLAGYWTDGGVVWLTQVRGSNLRRRMRQGRAPNPDLLLNGLDQLWQRPMSASAGRPFKLAGAFRSARRSFKHHLRDSESGMRQLNAAVASLSPFVRAWRPTRTAHNDFYDDQMLVLEDGRIALVDFEEAGPGDPMLDVGNFLAHLLWSSRFGSARRADASRLYRESFRSAALERFGWSDRGLRLREAVCLFRVCTNFIRHPQENWRTKLEDGLALVNEGLA